jgi:transcriptional regulator with XRE-family HTH domain
MEQISSIGDRVRSVRKRRGLTQRELATLAGVSLSLVKKLEQGEYGDVRLETVHKLAKVLRVPTSNLATGPDAAEPDHGDVEEWTPVRRALEGRTDGAADEEPTLEGLSAVYSAAVPLAVANQYAGLRAVLPALLRDADALVSVSVNGTESAARRLRSQVRQMTGYAMVQTWQFGIADDALDLALDDAPDALTAISAADWKCFALVRSGRIGDALAYASRWSDDVEPKISKASREELAAWGGFALWRSSAAVRDNRPGEAREAMQLAQVAAVAVGTDFVLPYQPVQTFGPVTVAVRQAENAIIQDRPAVTLTLAARLTAASFPMARHYHRHLLDVASAHTSLRDYAQAVAVLQQVRRAAPEWLAQQRYARDILGRIVERRRTLTPEMRDLADAVRLPL